MNTPTRRLGALAAPLLAGLALAPVAVAAPGAVQAGGLDWTMANVYDSAAAPNANRTWLGYTTSPPPLASGTATPSAGATGQTVTPTSARGVDRLYTFGFPATGGTFDLATQSGTVELDGVVTFRSDMHGFTISVEKPQIVLAGATGQLFGSGTNTGGTYDRSGGPIFDLALDTAQVTDAADGTRTITGIVPRIATEGLVFPSGSRGYAKGSGPDRTPNTFGSFSLRVKVAETLTGTVTGRRAAKTVRVLLAEPLGPGRIAVRLLRKGRVVATGKAKGTTLTLRPKKTKGRYRAIKGAYTLRGRGLAPRPVTVK